MAADQFVIWTRFTTHTGYVVRHAYGPYPTRSRAQSALRRMLRDHADFYGEGGYAGDVETQVTKLVPAETTAAGA